jgi:8-oxo-dGTP diphosphatase
MTDRQQPLIAIDVVPVDFNVAGRDLRYGTVTREFDPYAGQEALPGVLLGADETLRDAALRALSTKAGIDSGAVRHLQQIAAFDGPDRDPRETAISIAFVAITAPDAGTKVLRNGYRTQRPLPFDHGSIIDAARDVLRTRLWSDQQLTAALTGPVFDTAAARALAAQVNGRTPDAGNLNRLLRGMNGLERAGQGITISRAGGRPPVEWKWTQQG